MMYVLTLDIDSKKKFRDFVKFVKENNIKNVFVRESANGNYHVKIFIEYNKDFIENIRKKFDDEIRYKLDKELIYKPKNVLFDLKMINGKIKKAKSFHKLSS